MVAIAFCGELIDFTQCFAVMQQNFVIQQNFVVVKIMLL
jgi:hypothetical protein